jgi:hypothetical protein
MSFGRGFGFCGHVEERFLGLLSQVPRDNNLNAVTKKGHFKTLVLTVFGGKVMRLIPPSAMKPSSEV